LSFKNITYFIFTVLVSTGCQKGLFDEKPDDQSILQNQQLEVKENPADKEPPKYSMTYAEFEKSFESEVVPSDKAFIYDINFKWNPFQIPKKLRIRQDKRVVETATNTAYFKYTTNHDQTLNFTFEVLNEENHLEHVFTKTATVPKDFVVDQNNRSLIPSEITEKGHVFRYNRVFLSEEYSLLFDQAVNFIEINHLYTIDKAVNIIENIDTKSIPDYRASPEKQGKNGNVLYLVINNLYGRIMIVNRGQNGGHGVNGEVYASRAADGSPAKAGKPEICDRPDNPRGDLISFKNIERFCGCLDYGRPGTSGVNGANGLSGTNAGNGGDSGSVSVKVTKVYRADKKEIIDSIYSDDLNFVQVKLISGLKGNKGLGSEGQAGGIGGAAATTGQCTSNATRGLDGVSGKKGSDGLDGVDGQAGKQCLAIPVLGVNYCE